MTFEKEKKDFLTKKDKSRKGSIDKEIKKLVDKINSLKDYYTTSSCSGRILILAMPKSGKKQDIKWIYSSHNQVSFNAQENQRFFVPRNFKEISWEINKALKKIKNIKEDLWFRTDPAIIHITSSTIENAVKLLNLARDIGFRRSGIIGIRKTKVSIELISTERLETIIAKRGKIIINEDYLKHLIKEANEKLRKTRIKINKLYDAIKDQ